MRSLQLDYQRAARPRALSWALLGLGVLVALILIGEYRVVADETARHEDVVRKFQAANPALAAAARPVDPKEAKAQEERVLAARGVIEQLAVPWGRLFTALEGIDDKEVALLQLSPDLEKRQIKLLVEAKNLAAMVRYHQQMEQSGVLNGVALIDHEIQDQDPDKPVRFNISAAWDLANDARK
jgi:Tfp pilus assembly protein PilN